MKFEFRAAGRRTGVSKIIDFDQLAYIVEIFLAIIITFFVTVLGCAVLVRSYFLKRKKNEDLELRRMLEHVANKQGESQMVLASLNFGVIAYGNDDVLLLSNDAASEMLPQIPHQLSGFFDLYDENQTLQAALLLGKKQSSIVLIRENKHYKISVEERTLGKNKRPAHIISVQDITGQVREEQQRKEFVANVSHELKTPLTTIKTYAETLLDWGIDEKSKEAVKKDIERLYTGSIRMENLINDLLLLSRIDGKAIYTRFEQKQLAPIVRNCVERMCTEADLKNIEISSYAVSDQIEAFVDVSSFERIIMNLISNAIKYTPRYGEVKIYIGNLIDDVYVKVIDNGIGIPQEAQKNIFKRFYRVDATGSREHGGTGLGLSIVKELVDLHLGQLDLKSAENKGSEFTVLLPGVKKVMRRCLYELTEKGSCSNMVTKSATEKLEDLAHSLNIMAQWNSLQETDINRILKAIENI